MKRKAEIIRVSEDGKRYIAIDLINKKRILKYIGQNDRHKSKFIDICNILLNGLKNRNLYDKEDINNRCKKITSMKFFKGQENDRIYCKEMRTKDKTFVIIASELLEKKKSQKNTQKEINLIEKVAKYEYEITKKRK